MLNLCSLLRSNSPSLLPLPPCNFFSLTFSPLSPLELGFFLTRISSGSLSSLNSWPLWTQMTISSGYSSYVFPLYPVSHRHFSDLFSALPWRGVFYSRAALPSTCDGSGFLWLHSLCSTHKLKSVGQSTLIFYRLLKLRLYPWQGHSKGCFYFKD